MLRPLLIASTLGFLAACGGTPLRYDVPVTSAQGRIPVSVGSVEVRDVSLPLYAEQEVIYYEDETGAVVGDDNLLWADDPQRHFTESLAQGLASRTSARVAAEPWPFYDRPAARLDVRISKALPSRDGQYRVSGQYFVSSSEGTTPERARRFDLAAPYQPGNVASIAAAKSQIIGELVALIARDGL
ncbi:PqiC family protein [Palleronia caenipelagi]|uniref:Membrane integrity-associated transporter subunit PqiC n=1 Tax=Palleronia caenipelagi TaxID=2489174 RepID=A0A547Q2U4_9RHOB|nr:PqiC family protein [Palleronia caenipelagi]TRD20668.1 membrane integrity-associated transporter subunit PqiC [Palleronia caenipelagi]